MTQPPLPIAPFDFLTAGHIRFGRGVALQIAPDAAGIGKRVLLVRGRSVRAVDTIAEQLVDLGCELTTIFGTGEPTYDDVERATAIGRAANVDVVVSIGGGAVLDLGKALAAMIPAAGALMTHLEGVGDGHPLTAAPLPHIAIPTTAGTGSEVTKNAVIGVPTAGRKVSLRDNRMLPRLAVIDPALMDNTPTSVTFAAGFDAVTQVIEPYLCNKTNPLTDALCKTAIPMGLAALALLAEREDETARDHLAYVSLIGGLVLANAGLGAVHGLAGVIGGRYAAPHGLICARLLGPVLHLNKTAQMAANAPLDRYQEIETWIASAFNVAPQQGFDTISNQLDALELPRLGKWISDRTTLEAIAQEAVGTSSFKANPHALNSSDLAQALSQAL